jgi:hypothetical protein
MVLWMHALFSHDSILGMDGNNNFQHQNTHHSSSEPVGTVRNDSEAFGTVPNHAEPVGSVPNRSEELESVETFSLTVRDVARMFENAGVPRTERSIVKWCVPSQHGVPRLAGRYEPNERRWFITEESVRLAIAEEVAKQREAELRNAQAAERTAIPDESERLRDEPLREGTGAQLFERTESTYEEEVLAAEKDKIIRELEYKLRDEQIASRAKDIAINRLENEHMHLLDHVAMWSRQVGVLETKLLQIEGPKQNHSDVPNDSEPYQENPGREGK